jgi:hypothetical protein
VDEAGDPLAVATFVASATTPCFAQGTSSARLQLLGPPDAEARRESLLKLNETGAHPPSERRPSPVPISRWPRVSGRKIKYAGKVIPVKGQRWPVSTVVRPQVAQPTPAPRPSPERADF